MKKRIISILLVSAILISGLVLLPGSASAKEYGAQIDAKSAILMDATTGEVLFEQNADEPLPPASVTKIMTLLLVMEALDAQKISLDDKVVASAHASEMGGSQIYLKAGEEMSVEDLLKSVVVSSANDAAVALAEHICGSEEAFVSEMNRRANELGMNNTHFENTNGLDDTTENHVTSARDIAIMSRELLKHEKITEYSSIWMSTIRDGAFTLTNTNRLVRFYPGATGLKTGSTSKAKFCISATAKRDNMHLIAVIMGAPTRDIRNEEAKKLLDFGFANFSLYEYKNDEFGSVGVTGGLKDVCELGVVEFSKILDKGTGSAVKERIEIPEKVAAPLKAGDEVGKIYFEVNGEVVGETSVICKEDIAKISYFEIFMRMLKTFMVAR